MSKEHRHSSPERSDQPGRSASAPAERASSGSEAPAGAQQREHSGISPVRPEAAAAKKPRAKGDEKEGKKKKKKKKSLGSQRGVETMFRTSYQTHIDLSAIADGKANIMISINGLILSILLAAIAPRAVINPWLLLPTTALLITCLVSIIYAVLCARPRVSSAAVRLEDVRQNRANILFFGNFINMPREEYVTGMSELMQDTDKLYENMMRDLYALGKVLARKFALLRVSYTVFMIGLAISVALFITFFVLVTL
jgi:hypothetical protein